MTDLVQRQNKDPKYGWLMVFVVFVLSALSFGSLGAISVFLKPLAAEFGWSRGQTSLGYTSIAFSSALFGLFWGVVADRVGTRWFGVIAAIVMTFSLYLLSKQSSIIHFYAFYFLFGAFGNAMVSSPLFANVGFWFRYNPGFALGITAAGGAFGQGVVPYFAGVSIAEYGWRNTYLIMAISYLAIALPIAFFIRESPWREKARVAPQDEVRHFPLSEFEVVAWLSLAIIFCCNCMAVPIVHLVPLLTDNGHSMNSATSVFMVLMFAGVFGRIIGGKLGDVIGALPTYALMSLGQTFFVIWFPYTDNEFALYLLAICFGFTYSGVMSSILVCTRIMVSARFAARAMSITSFFGWGGMGLGGFIAGLLFDISGNYEWSYNFASAMGIINLSILSLLYLRISSQGKVMQRGVT